jgi:hypothetical protein
VHKFLQAGRRGAGVAVGRRFAVHAVGGELVAAGQFIRVGTVGVPP